MHEIDRGVGLQQVAPGALAGMRLARDQQHAQILADAVDRGDGVVVGVGEFALERGSIDDLDDVAAGAGDGELQRHLVADLRASPSTPAGR